MLPRLGLQAQLGARLCHLGLGRSCCGACTSHCGNLLGFCCCKYGTDGIWLKLLAVLQWIYLAPIQQVVAMTTFRAKRIGRHCHMPRRYNEGRSPDPLE